jgi:hypothetical protein
MVEMEDKIKREVAKMQSGKYFKRYQETTTVEDRQRMRRAKNSFIRSPHLLTVCFPDWFSHDLFI